MGKLAHETHLPGPACRRGRISSSVAFLLPQRIFSLIVPEKQHILSEAQQQPHLARIPDCTPGHPFPATLHASLRYIIQTGNQLESRWSWKEPVSADDAYRRTGREYAGQCPARANFFALLRIFRRKTWSKSTLPSATISTSRFSGEVRAAFMLQHLRDTLRALRSHSSHNKYHGKAA